MQIDGALIREPAMLGSQPRVVSGITGFLLMLLLAGCTPAQPLPGRPPQPADVGARAIQRSPALSSGAVPERTSAQSGPSSAQVGVAPASQPASDLIEQIKNGAREALRKGSYQITDPERIIRASFPAPRGEFEPKADYEARTQKPSADEVFFVRALVLPGRYDMDNQAMSVTLLVHAPFDAPLGLLGNRHRIIIKYDTKESLSVQSNVFGASTTVQATTGKLYGLEFSNLGELVKSSPRLAFVGVGSMIASIPMPLEVAKERKVALDAILAVSLDPSREVTINHERVGATLSQPIAASVTEYYVPARIRALIFFDQRKIRERTIYHMEWAP